MQELEFDTQVTKKDLFHFLMHHFYTSFPGIFGVILSIGALIAFILGIGKRDAFQLVILVIMACLFTVIQPLQLYGKAGQQVRRNPVFLAPLHYKIGEKGISVSQNGESTTIEWGNIRKIVETKNAFLIYLTVMNANVVPKDQLGKDTEALKAWIKETMERGRVKLH